MNGTQVVATIAIASLGLSTWAVPQVSNVVMKPHTPVSAKIDVTYDLSDEPGIVTLDIHTNGVSIGLENVTAASGDVNHLVATGSRKIVWQPAVAWPGHIITNGSVTAVVTAWATNAPPNVMVVDLSGNGDVAFYEDVVQLPDGGLANDKYRTTSMVFRKIPARGVNWRMGSPEGEYGRGSDETTHWVTLSEDYYMGIYPVTQKQFALVYNGNDPSKTKGDTRPVEKMLWVDIMSGSACPTDPAVGSGTFFGLMRQLAPFQFILPTEAQWEYACRAGSGAPLYTGKAVTTADKKYCANANEVGWFGDENTGTNGNTTTTQPVGLKLPNAWGLYDMAGNVNEYCLDWYAAYDSAVVIDPKGPDTGERRVVRGGDWWYRASHLRSAYRQSQKPGSRGDTIGFRVACPAVISAAN